MSKLIRSVNIFLAVIIPVIIASGCATPLVVGGMSAAPSGVTYASSHPGKIESYQIVSYENTLKAVRRAAETLSLEVKKEEIAAGQASFQFADIKDRKVDLAIEQRTATMTYLKVDTGWFGPHGMGRLLIRQILNEVSKAGDFLEDCGDKPCP